jgi:hypothetical protein
VFRRLLGRLRDPTPSRPSPQPEPVDDSINRTLQELVATLHCKRGVDRKESVLLVRAMLDEALRSMASGLVTKCLEPATAAWAIANARLSPILASPRFVSGPGSRHWRSAVGGHPRLPRRFGRRNARREWGIIGVREEARKQPAVAPRDRRPVNPHNFAVEQTAGSRSLAPGCSPRRYADGGKCMGFDPVGSGGGER